MSDEKPLEIHLPVLPTSAKIEELRKEATLKMP